MFARFATAPSLTMANNAPINHFTEDSIKNPVLIGEGECAKVYAARCGSQRYAVKAIRAPLPDPRLEAIYGLLRDVSVEADVQKDCLHPNILKCVDACYSKDGSHFFLFTELAPHRDIERVVKEVGFLDRDTALRFYYQIVDGLRVIHSTSYAHRDIKPSNILAFSNSTVKIGDFGSAKPKARRTDLVSKSGAHDYYRPPEMADMKTHYANGVTWDLYGAAMVYVYMLLGTYPWCEAHFGDAEYAAFNRGKFEQLVQMDSRWERVKEDFWFIRRLLHHDPKKRIRPNRYYAFN